MIILLSRIAILLLKGYFGREIVHCATREKKIYFASVKFDARAKRDWFTVLCAREIQRSLNLNQSKSTDYQ